VFGVAPSLLTDRIDPAAEAVIARVAPDLGTTDVGSPVKNSILAVPVGQP